MSDTQLPKIMAVAQPREARLDAWYDGSAICLIAIGASGDPLDLGEQEVEQFIEKLRACLQEAGGTNKDSQPVTTDGP